MGCNRPAIWGDFEKSIMMEACQNVEIINENALFYK